MNFASYIPSFVKQGQLPKAATASFRFSGTVLFTDITGFTPLASALAEKGTAGTEELSRALNAYFDRLLSIVSDHGGDPIKFVGDAILVVWNADTDKGGLQSTTLAAARCGRALQDALSHYEAAPGIFLSMRVALAAGPMQALQVGGVDGRWHVVTGGVPFGELALAENLSESGEVIAAPSATALLGKSCSGAPRGERCYRVDAVEGVPVPAARSFALEATGPDDGLGYVPIPVRTRLVHGHADWLSELRRITAIFITLIDFDHAAPEALGRLQVVTEAALKTFDAYKGFLTSIVVDEKGVALVGVFGVPPLAHEDDPVRALRAALDLSDGLGRAGFGAKIGVATGRAFCGVVGNDMRREYSIVGDVVNLTARLTAAAQGGVICDEATREAASTRLSFETLPKLSLKGKAELIAAFRPTFERPPDIVARPEVVVGRVAEQAAIRAAIEAIAEQDSARIITIEGEAGIGKSRLLGEALRQAQMRGIVSWSGGPDPIAASLPYNGWRSIFAQIIGLTSAMDLAARRQTVDDVLGADLRERAPLLNTILGLNFPENGLTEQMTAEVRAENTRSLLTALVKQAVAGAPHVIIIEDAHWLDSLSWALMLDIVQDVRSILLIVGTRPIAETQSSGFSQLISRDDVTRLTLSALSTQDTLALISARLGVRRIADPVGEFILERANGHPLFTEEIAFGLRDRKAIVIEGDECRFARGVDPTSVDFPDTLTGLIASRVDLLSSQAALALKVASVVGLSFSVEIVRNIYPISDGQPEVPTYLSEVERSDFTWLESQEADLAYIFRHVVVQEATYSLLLFQQRRTIHLSVAEWYERHSQDLGAIYSILAYHWSRAGDAVKALSYLELAGEQAIRNHANLEAVAFFTQARKLAEEGQTEIDVGRRARWDLFQGEALVNLSRYGEGRQFLESGLAALGSPPPRSEAGRVGALLYEVAAQIFHRWWPSRFVGAKSADRGRLLEMARAMTRLAEIYFFSNDKLRTMHVVAQGLNICEAAGPSAQLAESYVSFSGILGMVKLRKSEAAYVARAFEICAREENATSRAWTWVVASLNGIGQGDFARSLDLNLRAYALATRTGDIRRWCEANWNLARIAYFRGDFAEGLTRSQEMYEVAVARRLVRMHIAAAALLGTGQFYLGRLAEASSSLREARELDASNPEISDLALSINIEGLSATVAFHEGRRSDALGFALKALTIATKSSPLFYDTYDGYVGSADLYLALLQISSPEPDTPALLERSCVALKAYANVHSIGQARYWLSRGRQQAFSGKADKSRRSYQIALDWAERLNMKFDAALARFEMGRRFAGEDPRRQEMLQSAADGFAQCGAPFYESLVRRELSAPPQS